MQTNSARGNILSSARKRSALFASTLALFTITANGCGGEAFESEEVDSITGKTSAAVIAGGTSPVAHDSIVQLRADRGDEGWVNCSGTVVSPHIVVTAKHCVTEIADKSFVCRSDGEIVPDGTDAGMFGATFEPNSLYVHMGATPSNTFAARGTTIVTTKATSACRDDLAILVVDRPIVLDAYVPIRWNPTTRVGEKVTLIGYGMGEMKDTVLRREVPDVEIRELEVGIDEKHQTTPPRSFTVGGDTVCSGDSGGPALSRSGALVGAYSRVTGDCFVPDSRNTYMLTAGFPDLITEAFKRTGESPLVEPDDGSAASGNLWDPSGQTYGPGADDGIGGNAQTSGHNAPADAGVSPKNRLPMGPRCSLRPGYGATGLTPASALCGFLVLLSAALRTRRRYRVACVVGQSRTARCG